MSKFIVDKSFWELFPNAKIGVLLLKNFTNENSSEELIEMLNSANENAKKHVPNEPISENEVVRVYRDAYKKFKTKKGARSSIEALLKRAKTNPVGSINPLVDIYNAASLNYALPCGAEDMDKFVGDLKLTITEGGDEFYLIGDEENNPTLSGELCYKDDAGAVCRCFNWRDGERTMLTDETKNAFLVMELVDERVEDLKNALDFISENAKKFLNAEIKQYTLTKDDFEIDLEA